jgi:hemerythrin superfamily protein
MERDVPQAKPDAIALLKEDHRKVEALFEAFDKARKADRKSALAREICAELTVHTMIEEEIFYPACKDAVEEDLLNEAYVEHDGAKVLIAEILAGSPDDEFFDAKVKVLSEQIKHHVREEEMRAEGLFAQARGAGLDVAALGERLTQRKEALMKEFKKSGLPTPETRSFTGSKLKQGVPFEAARAAE